MKEILVRLSFKNFKDILHIKINFLIRLSFKFFLEICHRSICILIRTSVERLSQNLQHITGSYTKLYVLRILGVFMVYGVSYLCKKFQIKLEIFKIFSSFMVSRFYSISQHCSYSSQTKLYIFKLFCSIWGVLRRSYHYNHLVRLALKIPKVCPFHGVSGRSYQSAHSS